MNAELGFIVFWSVVSSTFNAGRGDSIEVSDCSGEWGDIQWKRKGKRRQAPVMMMLPTADVQRGRRIRLPGKEEHHHLLLNECQMEVSYAINWHTPKPISCSYFRYHTSSCVNGSGEQTPTGLFEGPLKQAELVLKLISKYPGTEVQCAVDVAQSVAWCVIYVASSILHKIQCCTHQRCLQCTGLTGRDTVFLLLEDIQQSKDLLGGKN